MEGECAPALPRGNQAWPSRQMQWLVDPHENYRRAKKRAKELVKSEQAKTQTDALDVISFKEVNKPWALAMAQLQQNSDSSNYLITFSDIERIVEQEPLLDYNGFGHSDSYHESFYKRYTFQDSKAEYLQNFKKNRESLKNLLTFIYLIIKLLLSINTMLVSPPLNFS